MDAAVVGEILASIKRAEQSTGGQCKAIPMQGFFLSRVLGMMCGRKIGPHETGEFCHTERTEHEQEEINRRAKYWIPKGGRIWSSGSNVRTSTVRKSQAVMGAQCAISILTLRHLPLAAWRWLNPLLFQDSLDRLCALLCPNALSTSQSLV